MPAVFLLQTICPSSVQGSLKRSAWMRMVVSTKSSSQHLPLFLSVGAGIGSWTDPLHQYGYFQSIYKTCGFLELEGAAEPVAGVQGLATIPVPRVFIGRSPRTSPCTSAEMSDRDAEIQVRLLPELHTPSF